MYAICCSVIGWKRPLSLPTVNANAQINVDDEVVMVESEFEHNCRLYAITFVSEDFITAHCFYPTV
eukprot:scaffold42532_cov35-Attheya_sp.AAC.2